MSSHDRHSSPFLFTHSALCELRSVKAKMSSTTPSFIRIGIKGGGCAGFSYLLALDQKDQDDKLFEIDGMEFIVNKTQIMFVLGLQIDWQNNSPNRGFVFTDPSADKII